jgi:hypothetical protein
MTFSQDNRSRPWWGGIADATTRKLIDILTNLAPPSTANRIYIPHGFLYEVKKPARGLGFASGGSPKFANGFPVGG